MKLIATLYFVYFLFFISSVVGNRAIGFGLDRDFEESFIAVAQTDGSFRKVDEVDIVVPIGVPKGCLPNEQCEAMIVHGQPVERPILKKLRLRGNINPKKMRDSAAEFRSYADALEGSAEKIELEEKEGRMIEVRVPKVGSDVESGLTPLVPIAAIAGAPPRRSIRDILKISES
eukprot:Filipodium_phascolosomae@DN988_c0_g1_i1.p1